MKIAIFGNKRQDRHLDNLGRFFSSLRAGGVEVCASADFCDYLRGQKLRLEGIERVEEFPGGVDAVVSIGGDGTFLRAAQWVGMSETPILGINTGHLGFLASYSMEENDKLVELLLSRSWEIEERMVLKVEGERVPEGFWPYLLNDMAVLKGDTTHMVNIRADVDGYYLADYLADGLIVSTPTGSTAYNLSVNGPILEPTLKGIILSPIAPHSLTVRPLVLGAETVVDLTVTGRGEECHVAVDGRIFSVPCDGARLRVVKAPFCVKVLRRPDTDFATILRNKLHWGIR